MQLLYALQTFRPQIGGLSHDTFACLHHSEEHRTEINNEITWTLVLGFLNMLWLGRLSTCYSIEEVSPPASLM